MKRSEIHVTLEKIDKAIKEQCPDCWHTNGADFIYYMMLHMYEDGNKDWSYMFGET